MKTVTFYELPETIQEQNFLNIYEVSEDTYLLETVTIASQDEWEREVGQIEHIFISKGGEYLMEENYYGSSTPEAVIEKYELEKLELLQLEF